MTPEFNRWWDADELTQTNPYTDDTPAWWAWEGWQAAQSARVDCNACANRGRIDGLSQETHCEHCKWQERWRTDHYVHNTEVSGGVSRPLDCRVRRLTDRRKE